MASYEADAVYTLGRALRSAKRWADRIRAAEIILNRLHGKPTQPIQQVPPVDVSGLSPEEMETLDHLLARVLGDGAGGAQVETR